MENDRKKARKSNLSIAAFLIKLARENQNSATEKAMNNTLNEINSAVKFLWLAEAERLKKRGVWMTFTSIK